MGNLGDVFGGKSANEIEERSFDPLPMGDYTLIVASSEMKQTKSGTGEYLSLKMQVVSDGKYKDRVFFENLNLKNPDPETAGRARADLAALCRAVRVPSPRDSSELHDKPFDARLGIQPGKGSYGPRNNIKKYARRGELGAATEPTGGGQASSEKKPWER